VAKRRTSAESSQRQESPAANHLLGAFPSKGLDRVCRSPQEVARVESHVPAPPAAHHCPRCHHPQTKITRVLGDGRVGSSSFVCSRMECALGIDVSKLETWIAD
jgi:hypothetical protein